ncbi:MAG: hypothetical protein FJ279_17105 [Planctomycetes bacterium]|nr:hypothetical protein [Planctomycetota bacterium]
MIVSTITCYLKTYIQPFERRLALAELHCLAESEPWPLSGHSETASAFRVSTSMSVDELASRLAYWEVLQSGFSTYTRQVRAEATANVVRNGIPFERLCQTLPFKQNVPLPNRRCLRYGTHGIHEYRGKFFPQLAVALINLAGVHAGNIVGDPMCGSGTALVESVIAGCSAYGLDLNPLSVLMARTKCDLLSADPKRLMASYSAVREYLLCDGPSGGPALQYLKRLPDKDQSYLLQWFSPEALHDLDRIATYLENLSPGAIRNLMWLSLSNILRRVSWQKEDDLRVRKEVRADTDVDPIREFLEELGRSVRLVTSFLIEEPFARLGHHHICEGDVRKLGDYWNDIAGRVDLIITSPPYATALPYLDTDRLSLIYLKLLSRPHHRTRDYEMIGNREVSDRLRAAYWEAFHAEKRVYPSRITRLIERIHELNQDSEAGFRKRNLPALLAKYFRDMRLVLDKIRLALRKGSGAFVVVGNNHTVAGGRRVDIETAGLLFELGESVGLQGREITPMEMLVSRDIFKNNASDSEFILHLRRRSL